MLGLQLKQISRVIGVDKATARKAIREQGLRHVWEAKRYRR